MSAQAFDAERLRWRSPRAIRWIVVGIGPKRRSVRVYTKRRGKHFSTQSIGGRANG